MLGTDRKVVNLQPKRKILTALLQNCKRSAKDHSMKKFLLYFKKKKNFQIFKTAVLGSPVLSDLLQMM